MNLSFMWHMHQPDYRDKKGVMQMPWVFLHAIKDYYDMPWMLSRYDSIKATFNITSSLIEQLDLYKINPQESDKFLSLWLKKPAFLQDEEQKWVIKICKSSQFDTMVKKFPRYAELYHQDYFNSAELRDLEVLFILSWCGVYLKKNNTHVKDLINKEKNYTDEDKKNLLAELSKFISCIWDYYKELHKQKRITISTTPFYHPILPLLMDMKNAQKVNINTKIPKNSMTLADDAALHVRKAKDLFKNTFGFETEVFWPAEGAIDASSVRLLYSMGIKFIATDEAILYKSLNSYSKNLIYTPYNYIGMQIGFRDHKLSDLIGFEYRYKEAEEAANDFMSELQMIQNIHDNATVFVILDGENAWEFYENNGFDFFELLYGEINQSSWCKTLTVDEVKELPSRELINLEPGSWINGSFDTWVGESEKTKAWELLFSTRKDYEHHKEVLSQKLKAKITQNFLAAECSDWFWWYGSDHYTEYNMEFDTLFRNHLITIYNLLSVTPPADLLIPIIQNQSGSKFWIQPQSNITPIIDGKRDSFFEWMGCGVIDESRLYSTMEGERGPIRKIYYGQDSNKLYFAFEGEVKELCKNGCLNIIIDPLGVSSKIDFHQSQAFIDDIEVNFACNEWLELSIDKHKIKQEKISLRFEIEDNSVSVQMLPGSGELRIDLDDDYSKNWFI